MLMHFMSKVADNGKSAIVIFNVLTLHFKHCTLAGVIIYYVFNYRNYIIIKLFVSHKNVLTTNNAISYFYNDIKDKFVY